MDDHELTRRWGLVTQHREQALRVALARTRHRADAEDLVHEAMIKAVSVEDLRAETAGGLLSTIVIRLALDLQRRTATHRRFEAVLSAASTETVDERVTDEAEATWLAGQLIHLPVKEREVLLHRAAGHTNASTAAVLGLTYKSVESAFTRARGQLQLVWKATAALVLGVAAAVRRTTDPRNALASVTLAAAVLAVAVFTQPAPAQQAPALADGVFQSAHVAPRVAAAPPSTARRAPAPERAAPVAPQQEPSPTPSPSETVLVRTPTIGQPGLVEIGETTITTDGRTIRQGIEGCLSQGISNHPIAEPGCEYSYPESSPSPTPTAEAP